MDNKQLNRMGAQTRRGEIDAFRQFFSKHASIFRDYTFVDMYELSEEATLDGGDCCACYESKQLFVGLSSRTNEEGIKVYQNALKKIGWEVTPIRVKKGLHLKSFMTYMLGLSQTSGESTTTNILLSISDDEIGRDIYSQIMPYSSDSVKYKAVFVPDVDACNVVSIKCTDKRVIVYKKGFEQSEKVFLSLREELKNQVPIEFIPLDYDELAKIDGCLTCCSVLF